MKKLLYCAAALAMTLFAGSCQRENLEPDKTNGKVTFTVEVPAELQTKAIADGKNVDQLIYEVWWTKDKVQKDLSKDATKLYQVNDAELKSDPNDNNIRKATIELDLMNDQNFTILFWAQVNKADPAYITDNLTGVTYAKALDEYDSNDESLAAFYSSAYIVDGKHVDAMGKQIDSKVTLRRPFAQLNLGNDNPTPKYTINVLKSDVKVTSVPTVFNVATKETSEPQEISFQIADIPNDPKTLTVQDKPYDYVAMNYVFAGGDNVAVEYNIYTKIKGVNGEIDAKVNNVVKNVPLKENYRTNIVGNLLTSKVDYQIVVDANFNQSDIDLESLTDGLVQVNPDFDAPATSYTKMYEISSANGFVYAMTKLVPSMKTGESAEFYLLNTVDLKGMEYVASNVPAGVSVLLAKGAAPITRSSSDDIVIKGLKSAIFAEVKGTATFSDIVVDDYDGDGAALVEVNSGTVIVSDCEATNNNENEVELVGEGEEPVDIEKGDVSTLSELLAALRTNANEIKLAGPITIPAGTEVVLDLNGKIVSQEKEQTTGYEMILNDGTLTIKDSVGGGKISYTDTGNGGEYVSNTITNRGILTIEGGIIENLSSASVGVNGYPYVIDTSVGGDANEVLINVNGGKLYSEGYSAIRLRAQSISKPVNVNVTSGEIIGTIEVQNGNINSNKGSLIISGGSISNNATKNVLFIFGSNGDASGLSVAVSAGEFSGKLVVKESIGTGFISKFITGGRFDTDPTDFLADGYETKKANEVWEIKQKAAAKIGTNEYATLQEAFNVGGEITILRNIKLNEMAVLESGKTATLDLNGYAITVPEAVDGRSIYALNNKGNLTIKDTKGTGSISARGIYNGYNGKNTDETVVGARLIVESGNFYALDSNGGACIFNSAEAIINGGIFDGKVAAINGRKMAETTINGGTFRSESNYAIQQNNGGTLIINDAIVDRGFGAVGCNGGTVTIVDGTYKPTGAKGKTCHVVYVASGSEVSISGGEFKMNYPVDAVPDSGSAVASYYNGTLDITGGTFYAHFDNVSPVELSKGSIIMGGTYYNHSGIASDHIYIKNFIADGYVLKDGKVVKFVAKVGNAKYGTIDEAIANWTNNTTLTLLADVALSDVIKISSTEYRTLDLATYTMTGAKGKNAIEIINNGRSSASYTLDIKADANNPGGITASSAIVKTTGKSGVKDRPIIRFYNGVFNASNVINHGGSNGTNSPQFVFYNGIYNGNISTNRAICIFEGGTFNGRFSMSVDSSSYARIGGGKFKYMDNLYGSALNSDKFTIGSAKGVFDRGVYVDDEGYIVVGGPVITEFGDKFAAKANNVTKAGSYLTYSSVAENGLYYTNSDMAVAKHGEAYVERRQ